MQSNQPPPFGRPTRRTVAPVVAAASAPPAVILYGVPRDVAAECERVATELRLAHTEVKHLHAACVALKTHPRALLVAAVGIRSWDREVVEEHAARVGAPLHWVQASHFPDDVADTVRAWALETLRTGRSNR